MRPLAYTISGAVVAAALALGPSSAWAQTRPSGSGQGGPGGARTSSGGGTSSGGSAVSRGDAGGGSTTSSSGGSSGSSMGSFGGSSGSMSRPSGGGAVRSGGGVRVNPQRLGAGEPRGEAVPRGARPNYDNPTTGRATTRVGQPPIPGRGNGYYWPYDYRYGGYYGGYYGNYGYYGMRPWGWSGLYFYNPFWWGYGYPYGLDTYGGSYYGDYYGGYGYGYGSGYGYGPYANREWGRGGLKLKVKPRDAEVYVDGFYMGQVDKFDGTFQQLELEAGGHRVEIRARGFETISFEVNIDPRETITYRGELQPVEIK